MMKIYAVIKAVVKWLGFELLPPKPELVTTGQISGNTAYSILQKQFPNAHIFISDGTFTTCPVSEVSKMCQWSKVKDREYLAETFDCDDFAYSLQGAFSVLPWSALPVGIVWTDRHAMNIFISDKQAVWFVEPQTYEIKQTLDAEAGEEVQLIVM